ncbi:hypothetical protein MWN34_12740 [Ancylobacter sp. 6x-1]|uniref:Uncharacterized protein n=1 Tax=Ancylobacter crimeensis TaxID=2579147 RepID=A0ABT0DDF3_9HYPH|nr:hypothetical protein [Ancylobacter crimeensis]MCK0197777.1 hypothetical protein [Ancylobacter crimeensis]
MTQRRTSPATIAGVVFALLLPNLPAQAESLWQQGSGRATSPSYGATLRGLGQRALPGGPPSDSLERRLNLPGSRANPPVRGTNLDDPACPPARPNCIPTMQR